MIASLISTDLSDHRNTTVTETDAGVFSHLPILGIQYTRAGHPLKYCTHWPPPGMAKVCLFPHLLIPPQQLGSFRRQPCSLLALFQASPTQSSIAGGMWYVCQRFRISCDDFNYFSRHLVLPGTILKQTPKWNKKANQVTKV